MRRGDLVASGRERGRDGLGGSGRADGGQRFPLGVYLFFPRIGF